METFSTLFSIFEKEYGRPPSFPQKEKFSIKDFFSKCDQNCGFGQIC